MCAKKGKTILIRQDDYVCSTANISNKFKRKSIIPKIYSDMPKLFEVSINNNSSRFIVLALYIT